MNSLCLPFRAPFAPVSKAFESLVRPKRLLGDYCGFIRSYMICLVVLDSSGYLKRGTFFPTTFLLLLVVASAFVTPSLGFSRCNHQTIVMSPQHSSENSCYAETNSTLSSSTSATSTTGKEKTTIVGIRHATSIANEWMHQPGNEWGDATFRDDVRLRDAPLSPKGRRQAESSNREKLSALIQEWSSGHEIIVVVSPLTRCLETWYYGVRPLLLMQQPHTIVLPLARERVYTSSDIGRTKSQLQEAFHQVQHELDWSLLPDNDEWWYVGSSCSSTEAEEWRPHGQGQYYAVPGEPEHTFETRMVALKDWLADLATGDQPKLIVFVSHWGVLRHLTKEEVKNGGICTWEVE